jgi:hypothetical protein
MVMISYFSSATLTRGPIFVEQRCGQLFARCQVGAMNIGFIAFQIGTMMIFFGPCGVCLVLDGSETFLAVL